MAVSSVSSRARPCVCPDRLLLVIQHEKGKSLSHIRLFVTPWTVACQTPLSMGSPGKNTGVGLPFPSPGDLVDSGIEPRSPAMQVDSLPFEPPRNPYLNFIGLSTPCLQTVFLVCVQYIVLISTSVNHRFYLSFLKFWYRKYWNCAEIFSRYYL